MPNFPDLLVVYVIEILQIYEFIMDKKKEKCLWQHCFNFTYIMIGLLLQLQIDTKVVDAFS